MSSLVRSLLRFEPSNWRPYTATRCAVGVAIPVFASAAVGHAAWGVLASLGALYAGMASFSGVYYMRLRLMLGTTTMMAFVTLLGSAVSGNVPLAVSAVVVVAFVLAIYASKSPSANTIAIQGTGVLVVLSGIPASAANPIGNALLVLSGGLIQTLILSIVWPINPHYPERRSVASIYSSLARFVESLPDGQDRNIPEAQPFIDARAMLEQTRAARRRPEHAILHHALRTAEALRAGLVGFARADAALRLTGSKGVALADAVAETLRGDLRSISNALRRGGVLGLPPCAATVQTEEGSSAEVLEHRRWTDLLCHQLRELREPPAEVEDAVPQPTASPFHLLRLPESGALRTLAIQHALRYSVSVGLAMYLSRLWTASHAYWLPLTVALILRPDYSTTLTRGLGRLVGTVAGVILAGSFIHFVHPSQAVLALLMLASAWLACALYLANYVLYSVGITLFVVFSVSASGLPEGAAGAERLEATLAGVVLAVIGNLLWPIWESVKVQDVLRDAIKAQLAYGQAVSNLITGRLQEVPEEARHVARSLRIEAERIVEAAKLEPSRGRRHLPYAAEDIIVGLDENAAILLTLHAEAIQRKTGDLSSDPEAVRKVDEALGRDRALELSLDPQRAMALSVNEA